MKPNDIISAWLAGLTIWGVAMLCLALVQQPDAPTPQEPSPRGIMVEDWYAQGFQDDGEAAWQPEWDESDRARSTFLPPLAPPSRQEGSNNQQDHQPSRQQ
jgi:hypothetical protein